MRIMVKLWWGILILGLAIGLVGCQQAAPAAQPEQPAAEKSQEQPAAEPAKEQAAGPVTIRVLTMQQAAMTTDEMDSVAQEFMAANPNVKVEMEYVSYDALHDKIVTAMATTPPPYDVVMVDVVWYSEFVKAGYLADVTDKITPD
ncbi:MAG: extracellular solute-binding protein, partial [Chloroflexota bacterium]